MQSPPEQKATTPLLLPPNRYFQAVLIAAVTFPFLAALGAENEGGGRYSNRVSHAVAIAILLALGPVLAVVGIIRRRRFRPTGEFWLPIMVVAWLCSLVVLAAMAFMANYTLG
ncbi:MAG: hypothetical protein K8T89_08495 [Planctomycetes bacterium]|nr:hypothetical protein [Planctomycetota bacterium]